MIGYWPLNEASGDTAYDHSGNENHGIINDGNDSTLPGANGPLGQNSYSFDGNNDFVNIGDTSVLNPSNQITVSIWINASQWGDDWNLIVDKYDGAHSYNFQASSEGGNGLNGTLNVGGTTYNVSIVSDMTEYLNNWHMISMTYSGEKIKTFWDGKLQNATSVSGQIYQSSADLGIANRPGDIQTRYAYGGKISELRLYDRPLTKSEVQYLYQVGNRGLHTTNKKTS